MSAVALSRLLYVLDQNHQKYSLIKNEKAGKGLEDLTLGELQSLETRIDDSVFAILEYAAAVSRRETPGGTGPHSVETQLEQIHQWLGQNLGEEN